MQNNIVEGMNNLIANLFPIFLVLVFLVVIMFMVRMLVSDNPKEVKKQFFNSLSKKDRLRKAWDAFWGKSDKE